MVVAKRFSKNLNYKVINFVPFWHQESVIKKKKILLCALKKIRYFACFEQCFRFTPVRCCTGIQNVPLNLPFNLITGQRVPGISLCNPVCIIS